MSVERFLDTNALLYDSLIVVAALEAGCTPLLTEDLQPGQRIETLIV